MTSIIPPTYYFSGISFNNAYYNPPSSYLTTTQAKNTFLQKKVADTAIALETFSGGIVTDLINAIGTAQFLTIGSNAVSTGIQIGSNNTTGNIAFGNAMTTGNINFGVTTSTGTINFLSPNVFSYPISLNYPVANIPSNQTNLGYSPYSFTPTGKVQSAQVSAVGTYTIYTPTTQLTQIGTYLVTLTGMLSNAGSNTGGSVSALTAGATYGVNSTASANPLLNLYTNVTTYSLGGAGNRDYSFNFSYPFTTTSTTSYMAGSVSMTIGVAMTPGTAQITIDNWAITRIG